MTLCALPGCDVEIEQPDRGPVRKFCSPAHRTAFRAARLKAAARPADSAATAAVPAAAPGGSATAPAPEAPEPVTVPAPEERVLPDREVAGLPGVRPTPPAALRRPVPLRELRKPVQPRTRRVVAAGLVFAMAFGGGISLLDRPESPAAAGGAQRAPFPSVGGQWTVQANIALASITRQLDLARASEVRWTRARGSAPAPAEVRALIERRQWLEQQRLLLESQLGAWTTLQQAQAALAMAERQLAELDAATRGPSPTTLAGEDLVAQRESVSRQVEMLRAQVRTWTQDVASAAATPLPDVTDATLPLALRVDDLVANPGRDSGPEGAPSSGVTPPDPALTARSPESGDAAVALPGTGEPPVPPGDDDFPEPVTPPVTDAPVRAVGDAARPVTDPVGDAARPVTDPVGEVARPVSEAAEPLTEPVTDLTGPVTDPLLGDVFPDPVTPADDEASTDPTGPDTTDDAATGPDALVAPVSETVDALVTPVPPASEEGEDLPVDVQPLAARDDLAGAPSEVVVDDEATLPAESTDDAIEPPGDVAPEPDDPADVVEPDDNLTAADDTADDTTDSTADDTADDNADSADDPVDEPADEDADQAGDEAREEAEQTRDDALADAEEARDEALADAERAREDADEADSTDEQSAADGGTGGDGADNAPVNDDPDDDGGSDDDPSDDNNPADNGSEDTGGDSSQTV